jgi:hypothetical protein
MGLGSWNSRRHTRTKASKLPEEEGGAGRILGLLVILLRGNLGSVLGCDG